MPTWLQVLIAVVNVVVLPFFSWVVKLAIQVARLERDLKAMSAQCSERLDWLRGMDGKLDRVDNNVVKIAAKLDIDVKE